MAVEAKLELDIENLKRNVKEANKRLEKFHKGIQRENQKSGKSNRSLAQSFSAIKVKVLAAVASLGLLFVGLKKIITAAADLETVTTKFTVLTGSVRLAKKHVKDLNEFAAKTPFQFKGIAESSAVLQGFGVSTRNTMTALRQIGDIAAITGQPLRDLAVIYGQVIAASRLTGERLLQLSERSVPMLQVLSKQLGVTTGEIRKMVEQGKITTPIFQEAFASMSREGGFAFEGMIKRSKP